MQKVTALALFFMLGLFFVAPFPAGAATKTKSTTASVSVNRNRLSARATFSNLTNVKSITYVLTYDSNKGPQGARGTIKVTSSKNLSRTLLFGTCSHNVCTYHKNVKNIKLSVDFALKSGGIISYEKSLK